MEKVILHKQVMFHLANSRGRLTIFRIGRDGALISQRTRSRVDAWFELLTAAAARLPTQPPLPDAGASSCQPHPPPQPPRLTAVASWCSQLPQDSPCQSHAGTSASSTAVPTCHTAALHPLDQPGCHVRKNHSVGSLKLTFSLIAFGLSLVSV